MVRQPTKILTFKRLTQVSRSPSSILDRRINAKLASIRRKIKDNRYGQFERAYLYVSLATCLEANIKYKARFAVDLSGNDIGLFKTLYGEAKLDLDLLFHVVEDTIRLSDLVAEVTNVSDVTGLLSRCEILLNAISGSKKSLRERFTQVAKNEKDAQAKDIFDTIVSRYEGIVSDIELVFQIRHAVVHDAFVSGGPVGWAVRRERLHNVYGSCLAFLLVFDQAFHEALLSGPYLAAKRGTEYARLHLKLRKEVLSIEKRLARRHPGARRKLKKLDDEIGNLILLIGDVLASVAGKKKSAGVDEVWPPDMAMMFFRFAARLFNLIELSSLEKIELTNTRKITRKR